MTDVPDKTLFSVNERDGEYEATYEVRGTISLTIKADSLEEARSMADGMVGDEDFGKELEIVDSVSVDRVRKKRPMFRVTRDGATMQVSILEAGDLPREPNEYGF